MCMTSAVYCPQLAGERCEKSFSSDSGNKEDELKVMLEWAFGGFQPTGPEGFLPPSEGMNHSSGEQEYGIHAYEWYAVL